ncbi:MAG: LysR family transcriptional regulator [Pseudomonadota bacterium]
MLLADLQIVVKVAEFRSITAAAINLDMRTATASAALKRVEKSLGTELFIRTTRQLRLSSAGERYIPQCQLALQTLAQAKQNIIDDLDVIEGELRLSVSSDLGRNLIIPWLDEFMGNYPKLRLRTNISDSVIDFYRDAVDIALRYGSPANANLYGFKICDVPTVLCASQAYLDKYGTPIHPQELKIHNGLFYQLHDIIHDTWTFTQEETEFRIKMKGNRVSNDGDLVRRWCAAGKGLAIKSSLDMSTELLSGKVLSVMPEFKTRKIELWLVCPSKQSITPTIRLLRDFIRERCVSVQTQLIDRGILQAHL